MRIKEEMNWIGIGGIVAFAGLFVTLLQPIGVILFALGLKNVGAKLRNKELEDYGKYSLVFSILGYALMVGLIIYFIVALLSVPLAQETPRIPLAIFAGLAIMWVVSWVMLALAGHYMKKALDILAQKTRESLFSTAGVLILIGFLLAIILIGFFIALIGFLIAGIGALQYKDKKRR